MRRGHPGSGGWRSDNPRPFRSRNGGTPHYRTPRNYTVLENTRCTPSIPRPHRGPDPYPRLTRHLNEISPENHLNRNKFREMNNPHNIPWLQNRSHSQTRNILPLFSLNVRQQNINSFGNFSHLYNNNQQERIHVNSLGDIDLRQQSHIPHNQASYGRNQHISPWSVPPPGYENKKSYNHQDKSTQKQYLPSDPEGNKPPVLEYGGHRPPSSDHYGGNPQTMVSNNNSFSRSVDDTVDIVRKRLMSRNESQHSSDDTTLDEPSNDQDMRENMSQHIQEEPPIKKRIQRQKQNVKANCDKMKSNIVHQLFKMDKDKMHKLMDNPSSSTKFEYAISSLITESQNSLHQHLRSVAEKSLYSSSKDFIHNDNNTIYEDTFMKQMQCLLDPQDTVLLEDIKPIVMAELSKVLQLDDLEQRYDRMNDLSTHYSVENQSPYFYGCHNYEESHPGGFCQENQIDTIKHENSEKMDATEKINYKYNEKAEYVESQVLYERRPKQKESNLSMDSQKQEMPINIAEVKFENSEKFVPQFDANADLLSDEEDPFAEFDRQYHVAVDPNFIENDDNPCIQEITAKIETDDLTSVNKEIDGHIQNIAKSQLELFPENNKDNSIHQNKSSEYIQTLDSAKKDSANLINSKDKEFELEQPSNEQEHVQPKEVDKVIVKSENATNLSKSSPISTQKRSTNQRPSHRKEKRKKSECSQPDITKYDSDKDKCCSTAKSIINLIFPRDDSYKEILKDNKKTGGTDKMYSDKYVKRKETSKKIKDTVSQSGKKRTSSTSSHSNSSPKDNNNTSQSATKSDPKTKLKTIDMFMKQPKKPTLHQSHRNTAPNSTTTPKLVDGHTTVSKHMGTQVYKKLQPKATQTFESKCMNTRYSQTEQVKCASKLVQTDPVISEKVTSRSNDAFERMKEIDMEIQVLLQEKFKLYSSLESKESCKSSMPTLGMTVLNVTAYDETKEDEEVCDDIIFSADSIVDDFSNIPAEELEQIALNSVQDDIDVTHTVKGSVVQKLQQEKIKSEIPSTRRAKKSKTPNISLLEQIITDDRPLEDIISLDDLEKPPVKSKRKPYKSQPKKKSKRTAKTRKHLNINSYKLKECSVLLMKADISNYLNRDAEKPTAIKTEVSDFNSEPPLVFQVPEQLKEGQIGHHDIEPHEIVGEALNELQFDMLDVSEDIVIGDNCEIKYSEDKDHYRIPISEDIILDNSQSSCDDKVIESGQVESVCKTYDYSTDENLRRDAVIVTGHADAVLAIECIENDFIAACLDGNVYHFSNDGQLLNTLRGSNLAVTCLTIVKEKYETIVYTGSLDSRIRYYDLETGLEKGPECNVLSPIQTMDRAWDTIFVGTRTGFVLQFECKNNMLIPVSTVKFSEQSILALRALKEGPRKVLLVAARSENVTIKDAQTGLLLRTLMGPKMTVYTLLFEDGKVYCGTSNHQIHVFDYSSGTHTACHEGGKGAVCLRATGGLLFAGCYDGCIYVYREGEPRPLAQLRGPSLMLLSLAIVGSKIIAGYKDRSLYIWKIPLSVLKEMIL